MHFDAPEAPLLDQAVLVPLSALIAGSPPAPTGRAEAALAVFVIKPEASGTGNLYDGAPVLAKPQRLATDE